MCSPSYAEVKSHSVPPPSSRNVVKREAPLARSLQEVDDELSTVLRLFFPETHMARALERSSTAISTTTPIVSDRSATTDRLKRALEREGGSVEERYALLRVHSEGLAAEIRERMELLRSMRVVEALHATHGELLRCTDVYRENVSLRVRAQHWVQEIRALQTARDAAEARAALLCDTVSEWRAKCARAEDQARRARAETERVREKAAQREAKWTQELEDLRVELCVAQNRATSAAAATPTATTGISATPGYEDVLEDVYKLSLYCCEATRHWVEQTEENNWAARTIQALSRALHMAEMKNWQLLVHVANTFGHMTHLELADRTAFHQVFEKSWAPSLELQNQKEVWLWGQPLAYDTVVQHRAWNVRFHVRGFSALSSYVVDWMDYLGDADTSLRGLYDLIQGQVSNMLHVSPVHKHTASMTELILQPLQRAMRRFGRRRTESDGGFPVARRFHADVFWQNFHRWNALDVLAYHTTGTRRDVVHAWLVQLLTSAALAVSTKASWNADAGLALLYHTRASDTAPTAVFSHYRVGLRMEHTEWSKSGEDVTPTRTTVEAWLPMAFVSFLHVLNIVDYLEDHTKAGGGESHALEILVRAKEITLTPTPRGREVRLKRMRAGTDVTKDPTFGQERLLRFPDADWLTEACFFFVTPPLEESKCLQKSEEDGSEGWIEVVGGVVGPRCDRAWIHTAAWSNYAFAGTPLRGDVAKKPFTANGAVALAETHLTASHVRWMRRKYLTVDALARMVSEDNFVSTVMHML